MNPSEKGPRLRMQGIRKRFGSTTALSGVDLEVASGEVLALVGENGAGKSTLMKILSGVHPPEEGDMQLDGKPYRPSSPQAARAAGVSMIYQELSIAPHLTVAENILLGAEPGRFGLISPGQIRKRAAAALESLGRPDLPLDRPAGSLSIAEQQMVEIARAVAVGCRVLALDEPTSSLGAADIQHLFNLVKRLRASGHAVIYISHFLEEVKTVSDRFTVLRDGVTTGSGKTADISPGEIIKLMVGRDVSSLYPRSERIPGDVILEVGNLAGKTRPRSASFALRRGEVLGIAGVIGTGRSELVRSIFGLDEVRQGTIRVQSWNGAASPATRWEQGVGMVSEDRKTEGLALSLSVAENLTLSRPHAPGWGRLVFFSAQAAACRPWIDRLKIKCQSPRQPVGDLSGGNQQKVAIARLLHHDVDVLLLDEPTRGIDLGAKTEIYRLIDELASSGKAVLMISSYLPELLGTCDRIAVMCRGVLSSAYPTSELNQPRIMALATGAEEIKK